MTPRPTTPAAVDHIDAAASRLVAPLRAAGMSHRDALVVAVDYFRVATGNDLPPARDKRLAEALDRLPTH